MKMQLLIQKLYEDGYRLGGSRRMAEMYPNQIIINEDTDYDFYAEYCPEREELLKQDGFVLKDVNPFYFDSDLEAIYKHPEYNIDVLLRHNIEMYTRVFESISAEQYNLYIKKTLKTLTNEETKRQQLDLIRDFFNRLFDLDRFKYNENCNSR